MSATTQAETTPSTPTGSGSSSPSRDIALIAAFAALVSASAYVGAIPVGSAGVPITLQTLTVMLAGCILGPVRGFAAVTLYLALGAVGLPVFAEHSSGIGVFSGISGGYLLSFPIAAALGGFLVQYVARDRRTRAIVVFFCSLAASVLVIHTMGIAGMKLYADVSWREAASWDMPFWIGDLVKTSLVAMIAAEVHRAFPQLLHRD
ncbi:BioY protein [Nocardioides sp. Root122]|jgi:biotin transport system substrate-specific component|uniref:biotin transporter BioY n=1 Tax=Nocardioides TaxID=1839 RepID=UPI000703BC7F|nr:MULTISPECIES: biotin transporter BioY [Nocardioides]KQV65954.1 BioY protein [Nocardioides sp. Root122]MCK9823103.1 biotin transporter BioY [Nocardioides cavernae]